MIRACDACGQPYEAATVRSKFCSKRCRSRSGRGFRPPVVAQLPSGEPATRGRVREATVAELERVGRLDTPHGAAALLLAEQIDAGGGTAAGMAALVGRWVEVLDRAVQGAAAVVNPLDELRRRRQHRLGAS